MARRNPYRILLAEDNYDMRTLLMEELTKCSHLVVEANHGIDFLDLVKNPFQGQPWDLIISDIRMPGVTGLEILEDIRRTGDATPVILITAFGDGESHARAKKLGISGFFDKPFILQDLLQCVDKTLAA